MTDESGKGGESAVRLIPQPHGGALLSGGRKGGPPGPGRPRESIRATLRQHLDMTMIEAVLADWRAGKLTSLATADFFAHYGLGTQVEAVTQDDVRDQVRRLLAVLVDELTARGWTVAEVRALVAKCASAADGDDNPEDP